MKKLHAIFGGNFDPIHYGHINSAKNLAKEISIEKIIFLPNNRPPHRDKTITSITDKIKMIKLAIYNNPLFQISYLETKKKYFLHYRYTKNYSTKNRLFKTFMFYNRRR